jgi:uncharacterized phage-like protein YoqJ
MDGKVCCFSGHRKLRHSETQIRRVLDAQIADMARQGYTRFLSGGADGFDLLAAEAVIAHKKQFGGVELWIVAPYADWFGSWTAQGRRLRLAALEAANVEIVCQQVSRTAPLARNRRMVQLSDACVCYMLAHNATGGTYYTVRLAREKGIDVINLAQQL